MRQKTLMELARMRKDVDQPTPTDVIVARTLSLVERTNFDTVKISDLKVGDRYRKPGQDNKSWTEVRSIYPCMGSHRRTHVIINDKFCHDTRANTERKRTGGA